MSSTFLTTKLCLLLVVCSLFTGCYHKKHIVTTGLTIKTVRPECTEWETPKADESGSIVCKPSWEDEPYLHDPACMWVYGGDEICSNLI